STAQDDQLLLEQEILRDHRSHATGATQLRGHDGQVKQREQEVLHRRDSVGQTSGATQVASVLDLARELGIRDSQVLRRLTTDLRTCVSAVSGVSVASTSSELLLCSRIFRDHNRSVRGCDPSGLSLSLYSVRVMK